MTANDGENVTNRVKPNELVVIDTQIFEKSKKNDFLPKKNEDRLVFHTK